VKPDNFLCTGAHDIKLCDFGIASLLNPGNDEPGLKGICGTPAFMAPEMLKGQRYDEKIDVWSFGVIAYVLLLGGLPYEPAAQTQDSMKAAILASGTAPPSFKPNREACAAAGGGGGPRPAAPSEQAAGLLRRLLTHSPSKRPSAEAALNHSCFQAGPGVRHLPSLRPMLQAARQTSAFHMRSSAEYAKVTDIDMRVCCLQGYPQGQTLPRLKMKTAWVQPQKALDERASSKESAHHQVSRPLAAGSSVEPPNAKRFLNVPTAEDSSRSRANSKTSAMEVRAPSKESRRSSKDMRQPSKESFQVKRKPSKGSEHGSRRPSNASSLTSNA